MQTDTEQQEEQHEDEETLGTRAELEELAGCKRRLKAAVPAEKVREEVERNYTELSKMVSLPGFRRGRVPRKLLEARYGEQVDKELKEGLVAQSFSEVAKENELKVVGEPNFENVEINTDLEYQAEFEVRPVIELPEYKGLEVESEKKPVADADVDEEVENLRKRSATYEAIDPASAGSDDFYRGKYRLLSDGAEVKEAQSTVMQPSSKVLQDFLIEDLVEKVAAWESPADQPLELDVTVPAGFADEVLRGTEVRLEFSLEEVSRSQLPELDEEFAKKLGKDDLAGLRTEIREALEERRNREEERALEERVMKSVEDATEVELPEGLLQTQRERSRLEREYELMQRGMNPDEVKEKLVAEGEAMEKELRAELKRFFILTEIADKEKVFVTEADVRSRVEQMAGLYGVPPAALREQLKSSGRLDALRASLLQEKTRGLLRKKASVKGEAEVSSEEAASEDRVSEGMGSEETVSE